MTTVLVPEDMEQDGVIETEFGLLRRINPPFPNQRQGLQMKGFGN